MVVYSEPVMFVRSRVGRVIHRRSTKWKYGTSLLAVSTILHLLIVQSIVDYVCSSSSGVELTSVILFCSVTTV